MDRIQREFIANKVQELGSVEAVASFYNKDCFVDDFANSLAKILFDPDNYELSRTDKIWINSLSFSKEPLMNFNFVKKLVRQRFEIPGFVDFKLPKSFSKAFAKKVSKKRR